MSRIRLKYKPYKDPENPVIGFLCADHVVISAIGKTEEEVFKKLCKRQHYFFKEIPKMGKFLFEKQKTLPRN